MWNSLIDVFVLIIHKPFVNSTENLEVHITEYKLKECLQCSSNLNRISHLSQPEHDEDNEQSLLFLFNYEGYNVYVDYNDDIECLSENAKECIKSFINDTESPLDYKILYRYAIECSDDEYDEYDDEYDEYDDEYD